MDIGVIWNIMIKISLNNINIKLYNNLYKKILLVKISQHILDAQKIVLIQDNAWETKNVIVTLDLQLEQIADKLNILIHLIADINVHLIKESKYLF